MTFEIKINLDNAAFDENPNDEINRILTRVVYALAADDCPDLGMSLFDINGNRVGFAGAAD